MASLVFLHYGPPLHGLLSPWLLPMVRSAYMSPLTCRGGFFQLSISLFGSWRRQMPRRYSGVVIDHLNVSILSLLTYRRHLSLLDLLWWCLWLCRFRDIHDKKKQWFGSIFAWFLATKAVYSVVRDTLLVRAILDLSTFCSLGLSKTVKIASLDNIIKYQLLCRQYGKSRHPTKQGESHFCVAIVYGWVRLLILDD